MQPTKMTAQSAWSHEIRAESERLFLVGVAVFSAYLACRGYAYFARKHDVLAIIYIVSLAFAVSRIWKRWLEPIADENAERAKTAMDADYELCRRYGEIMKAAYSPHLGTYRVEAILPADKEALKAAMRRVYCREVLRNCGGETDYARTVKMTYEKLSDFVLPEDPSLHSFGRATIDDVVSVPYARARSLSESEAQRLSEEIAEMEKSVLTTPIGVAA